MEIINCEQGTPDWYRARMGIPTASGFKEIIGVKKDAKDKVTRDTYMRKLAGEIITGEPMDSYSNPHMERGKEMEEEARLTYSMVHNVDLQRVGFIRNGNCGASPDSLVGGDGALEIKTALPHILAGYILKDAFPPEHKAQTQGILMVTERDWIDISVYWPKMPAFGKRAYRDDSYIKDLRSAVDQFNAELAEMVQKLRSYA